MPNKAALAKQRNEKQKNREIDKKHMEAAKKVSTLSTLL